MIEKARLKHKILSVMLAVVMVFGMLPVSPMTALAADEAAATETRTIMLDTSHITGGQASNVYFGTYQQSSDGNGGYNVDPIKWRVLSNADGKLFLLSDQNLDVFQYHTEYEAVTWETSTMRSWLNGLAASYNTGGDSGKDYTTDNFLDTAFSASEQLVIADTLVINATYDGESGTNPNPSYATPGGDNTTDKVFLLSIAEVLNAGYGFTGDTSSTDTRKATNTAYVAGGGKIGWPGSGVGEADYWWLRSPGSYQDDAAFVRYDGDVSEGGVGVSSKGIVVRPAFNLNLFSVLFTSAASGGKPTGTGLTATTAYTGNEYKLTLLDSSRNFALTDTSARTAHNGETLSLGYTGTTTGTDEYISAMIVDANGTVVYYGQLAQAESASGTVNLTVPADIASGNYTLKLFNEQINGDYRTDFSSDFVDISLTVVLHNYSNGICPCGGYEPAVDVSGEGALFRISNAGQLLWYAQQYNSGAIDGDAELTTDIIFPAGVALIPIGTDTRAYGGIFNGNGETVNFGEQTTTVGYFGIIGNLSGGTVEDLTISGAITVNANVNYVSGVVGAAASDSTIEGCTSYVDITLSENASGSQKISGIAGQITTGTTISHSANYGDISASGAKECIGGITGYANENCLITDCANYGIVSSDTATYVSGILGYINNDKFEGVQDCLNVGTISGSSYVGDIIGWARNYATDTIVNNYYNGTTGFGADAQSDKNATATKVTDDQLKSGEIAWLLNNSTSEGVWKQTIGTDAYPVFSGETVYYGYAACGATEKTYSNDPALFEEFRAHSYNNGFCVNCDSYQPCEGTGTVENPYLIGNAGQLYWFAEQVNRGNKEICGELAADIVINKNVLDADGSLNGDGSNFRTWTPIGNSSNYYAGTFDGKDFTVSGLYFNDNSVDRVGLFGRMYRSTVCDVGVVDSYLSGGLYVGGVVGFIYDGTVSYSYNAGTVRGTAYVGGVVGGNNEGTVSYSYNAGTVSVSSGGAYVGGVMGSNEGGTVSYSYNAGTVSGSNYVGGVVGLHYDDTVTDIYYLDTCGAAGEGTAKTAKQFASGEVAYLLNGSSSEGVWKQTLGTQDYPQFNGETVYAIYVDCSTEGVSYTNYADQAVERPAHNYDTDGICTACGAYEPAVDVGGEGALFRISNAGQLLWYAQQYNSGAIDGDAELTTDIIFPAGVALIPIGTDTRAYGGIFNGNGETVNFGEQTTTVGYFGIIGNLSGGTVKDLTVSGAITVNANVNYVSGVVGAAASDSTIEGCTSYVDITLSENASGSQKISGIAGQITTGTTISHSANYGDISASGAQECIGGITGYANENCLIADCANYGIVSSDTATYVSGILGYINNDKFEGVQDCLNVGTISGSSYVGDIIGWARNYATDTIVNNYYNGTTGFGADAQSDKNATVTKVTDDQLKSGEIAWLLNNSTSEGVWKQTLGTHDYPQFTGDTVYAVYADCSEAGVVYTNDADKAVERPAHNYDADGICTVCGAYEPAKLNSNGVYEIGNVGQLMWFAELVNQSAEMNHNAVLIDDIDINGVVWNAIARTSSAGYAGTFDGRGYTIKNLNRNAGLEDGQKESLFASIGEGGVVKNLIVDNADVWTSNHYSLDASGVIAMVNSGAISGCIVKNSNVQQGAYEHLGGIAGLNTESGVIENCAVVDSNLSRRWGGSSSGTMGGIVQTNNGLVKNCYTYGCTFSNGTTENGAIIAEGTAPTNCYYYTASTVSETYGTAKDVSSFTSGEVTYLLNGDQSNIVWKQIIGEDTYPNFTGLTVLYDETADPQYYNESLEIISVNISWGAMEFTYTDGEWQPESHTYSDGAWTPDEEGGNVITVRNDGNMDVNVTFAYDKTVSEVEGSFTDESGNAVTSSVALAVDEEKKFKLLLSGKPNNSLDNATLGSITVTIALPSEEEGS